LVTTKEEEAMHRFLWPVALLAVVLITGTAFAASWGHFVSKRYAYSIQYPRSWKVKRAKTDVTSGVPEYFDSSLDGFSRPRGPRTGPIGLNVRIGAQPVPSGTTIDDWATTEANAIEHDYGCNADASNDLTVAGEHAKLLTYRACPSGEAYYFLFIAVVHGDRGFQIYWLGRRGHRAQDHALFLRFVKTFRFRS
jgi:hypothetical protein